MQSLVEEGGIYGVFTYVVVFFFGGGGWGTGGGRWWVSVRASEYVHVYVGACV